uniref:Hemicentin-1-like von Willebrand factor A domain-containing protein n=1 Tax=Timema tahoe TaxID=61484 RepID=A0A7R9ILT1_9NEOP|nr:unnamed protein product [Timema tahoe]
MVGSCVLFLLLSAALSRQHPTDESHRTVTEPEQVVGAQGGTQGALDETSSVGEMNSAEPDNADNPGTNSSLLSSWSDLSEGGDGSPPSSDNVSDTTGLSSKIGEGQPSSGESGHDVDPDLQDLVQSGVAVHPQNDSTVADDGVVSSGTLGGHPSISTDKGGVFGVEGENTLTLDSASAFMVSEVGRLLPDTLNGTDDESERGDKIDVVSVDESERGVKIDVVPVDESDELGRPIELDMEKDVTWEASLAPPVGEDDDNVVPEGAPCKLGAVPYDDTVGYQGDAPEKVIAEEKGVDTTVGRGVSLTFVFDSTGSMWDDLVQVRAGAEMIMAAMLERQDNPIHNYVLVPFQDPKIGPVTVTTDHELFRQSLLDIYINGGGDCPEMAVGAIQTALDVSLPGSFIFVFTDARSKDYKLLNDVLSLVQRKQSQIVFVLTGHCNDLKHEGYLAYEKIAATSSGQVFHINKKNVEEVTTTVIIFLGTLREGAMYSDIKSGHHGENLFIS